jgi:hypothetical protein
VIKKAATCEAALLVWGNGSSIPVVITALLTATVLAGPTTFGAADRLVLEPLFLVERLLAFGKGEFRSAIFANNHFVRHGAYLLKNIG